VNLISLALKMVDESEPVLVLFQHQGRVKSYGSKNILDLIQDMLVKNEGDINTAVERDSANLMDRENCDDPLVRRESDGNLKCPRDRAKTLFKTGGLTPLLEPLPYPLSIMKFPETVNNLRKLLIQDRIERTGLGGQIIFGHPDWEPSFWPNHLWKWTDLKCNFNNLTLKHFPSSSQMTLLEFYKLCVKEGLELQGLDPETFYSSDRTKEELDYRRKTRACRSASRNSFLMEEKQAFRMDDSNPDNIDDQVEDEKFNVEHSSEKINYGSFHEPIEEDVKNVELEEYIIDVPLEGDAELLSMKRKSEVLEDQHPPPYRRSSVICYKV